MHEELRKQFFDLRSEEEKLDYLPRWYQAGIVLAFILLGAVPIMFIIQWWWFALVIGPIGGGLLYKNVQKRAYAKKIMLQGNLVLARVSKILNEKGRYHQKIKVVFFCYYAEKQFGTSFLTVVEGGPLYLNLEHVKVGDNILACYDQKNPANGFFFDCLPIDSVLVRHPWVSKEERAFISTKDIIQAHKTQNSLRLVITFLLLYPPCFSVCMGFVVQGLLSPNSLHRQTFTKEDGIILSFIILILFPFIFFLIPKLFFSPDFSNLDEGLTVDE